MSRPRRRCRARCRFPPMHRPNNLSRVSPTAPPRARCTRPCSARARTLKAERNIVAELPDNDSRSRTRPCSWSAADSAHPTLSVAGRPERCRRHGRAGASTRRRPALPSTPARSTACSDRRRLAGAGPRCVPDRAGRGYPLPRPPVSRPSARAAIPAICLISCVPTSRRCWSSASCRWCGCTPSTPHSNACSKSIECKGMLDPQTGPSCRSARVRATISSAPSRMPASAASACRSRASPSRMPTTAAPAWTRLASSAWLPANIDFGCRQDDGSIVCVFTETDLRAAHVVARRLASVLKLSPWSRPDREKARVAANVTLATLKPSDTLMTLMARIAPRPVGRGRCVCASNLNHGGFEVPPVDAASSKRNFKSKATLKS